MVISVVALVVLLLLVREVVALLVLVVGAGLWSQGLVMVGVLQNLDLWIWGDHGCRGALPVAFLSVAVVMARAIDECVMGKIRQARRRALGRHGLMAGMGLGKVAGLGIGIGNGNDAGLGRTTLGLEGYGDTALSVESLLAGQGRARGWGSRYRCGKHDFNVI